MTVSISVNSSIFFLILIFLRGASGGSHFPLYPFNDSYTIVHRLPRITAVIPLESSFAIIAVLSGNDMLYSCNPRYLLHRRLRIERCDNGLYG